MTKITEMEKFEAFCKARGLTAEAGIVSPFTLDAWKEHVRNTFSQLAGKVNQRAVCDAIINEGITQASPETIRALNKQSFG